jgi:hypothetical protein
MRDMLTTNAPTELVEHLCRHSNLTPFDAARLINEVLAFYDESTGSFIQRRHHELQKAGLANADIYRQIGAELEHHRFKAESLSERQIRRTIYG